MEREVAEVQAIAKAAREKLALIKERFAAWAFDEAERREGERGGQLTPEKTILDATSGNTGIAYAMICAIKGYRVKLCLPANASHERKQILRAYGAEVVITLAACIEE